MSRDLPWQLQELAELQRGILSRSQALAAGMTSDNIFARVSSGSWQRIHPGVYAIFTGELSRISLLWAAVLLAGRGAALSHQTAAQLWGLTDETAPLIHVTVPSDRRITRRPGMVVHMSARVAVHPAQTPPRIRLEETVIDLWETSGSLDNAVGWVARGIGRRLTTQDKLRQAMEARSRIRRRKQLAELLGPDGAGIHSVLEYRYVHNVERPHGLVGAHRQVRVRREGRTEYRDQLYADYATAVELDGRVAHPGDTRWNDIQRDNAASAAGITTLRYGWLAVTTTPCQVAAEIAEVLSARGYASARPCSADCPVGRTSSAGHSVASRQPAEATCKVPARSGRRASARTPRIPPPRGRPPASPDRTSVS
jgi:hypothetical protein